ncbi:MAG: hypothetical protein ABIQ59_14480 [Nocardioidaceae bacterium]
MTPHPLATWAQLTVSPQREATRRRRRRIAAHLVATSVIGTRPDEDASPRVPQQRRSS